MASSIDPTLGGDLGAVLNVRKAQMSAALAAAKSEIEALQAQGAYDLNGNTLVIDAEGNCTLRQTATNEYRFSTDGVDRLLFTTSRMIFLGGFDIDLDTNQIYGYASLKYNNLSGAQTLSRANFEAGATLVHSGAAATYTLPSRVGTSNTTNSDQLMIRNRGSGSITLSASGVSLKGNTTIAANESAAIEWEANGTTEYAWVDGGS
jgi:hypothetical protein